MDSRKFDEAYANLNPAQREAVDAIEGPVMVVAGPGTGKTQILTLRIANILAKTDTAPENILALTFTESGVAAMRRRLSELIGSPAYSVVINTFHGFCNDVIKNYPEEFPRIIGSANITEVDQIRILEEIIAEGKFKELRPFGDPLYYIRDILAAVNNLKREGVDPKAFSKIMKEERRRFEAAPDLYHEKGAYAGRMKADYQKLLKQLGKNDELAALYKTYEETLRERKLYDYSDMIMEVLRELETNKDLLLILQEEHQYILVDEHQDTNNAQNRVLERLASFHPNPNLFVVGDEKQAIFRFQGASLENFLYFEKLYPEAKLVILTDNYRSTQTVLDAAHGILASSFVSAGGGSSSGGKTTEDKGEKPLQAKAAHPEKKITLLAFSKPEVECWAVGKDVKRKLKAGVPAEEIAILYRDNKDAMPFAAIFERLGVPFAIESDQDVMADEDIKKLILILRTVAEHGRPERLLEALHVDFLGIPSLDIYKIINAANAKRRSPYEIVRQEALLTEAGVEAPDALIALSKKLAGWAKAAKNTDLVNFFEIVVRESGFLNHILGKPEVVEKMAKLSGLFDEVKTLVEKHKDYDLKDFLEYLATLAAHNLLVKKSLTQSAHSASSGQAGHAVRLMTAHRAKGQEFAEVYIVNAADGHWGNKRRPKLLPLPSAVYSLSGFELTPEAANDDERRLFYVALTRAKRHVTITYARLGATKREQLSSQFVTELAPTLVEEGDAAIFEAEYETKKDLAFAPRLSTGAKIADTDFISALFKERGLAVTALNNYLECPWKYFYTNLLRIPKAPEKHQMYGIAVHAALKDFFDAFHDRKPDRKFLLMKFDYYLNEQPLTKGEFEEVKTRGRLALGGWFDTYQGAWRTRTVTEVAIPAVFLGDDVRLTGKLDKVEFIGEGVAVNVVDYKTGRPKSRNEIEGKTQSSAGDIKRQLVFYNILLNGYDGGRRFKMASGEIDFVEPNERGKYIKESFLVTKDEIEELIEVIKQTAKEITTLAFWDKRCDEPKCEYCALREMMNEAR
ncbi:MAG: ATP-dependent DNA helicase [Patescibacteria group bacterium]